MVREPTRSEIARRYFDRPRTREKVSEIANAYGITPHTVIAIGREKAAHEKTPGSGERGGLPTGDAVGERDGDTSPGKEPTQ